MFALLGFSTMSGTPRISVKRTLEEYDAGNLPGSQLVGVELTFDMGRDLILNAGVVRVWRPEA